jgi:hypothetical protein
MTHSDSTYRQYTQALEEEEQKQQTNYTGTVPNGYTRGATPTNVSMFNNDAMALRSAYDGEEVAVDNENAETYEASEEWQNQPEAPVEIITSEARDYKQLWKWAYQKALKDRGITVSEWGIQQFLPISFVCICFQLKPAISRMNTPILLEMAEKKFRDDKFGLLLMMS